MVQILRETANIWEYKVGTNANIAIFVHLWKPRITKIKFLCIKLVYNLKYLLNSFVKRNKQLEKCSVIEQNFICVTTDTPIMDFTWHLL